MVTRDLPVRGLPAALVGKTLAQLSDLHVGPLVDDDYLISVLTRVTTLAPDFVVFTGDFITYQSSAQIPQLRRVLESMPRGRMGTVAILGNHDYSAGWANSEVAAQVVSAATEAGATVLRNEVASIGGLTFVGLDDLWAGRTEISTVQHIPAESPAIALVHNPDAVDLPGWDGFRGWILSGHTHGGQVKPPLLPPPILPVQNRRYAAGAVDLGRGRHLYVSRGVGHHLRVRFNCRPEVTMFRLVPDTVIA